MKWFFKILWLFILILSFSCDSDKEIQDTKESINPVFINKNSDYTNISFSNNLKNSPELNILNYIYYYNGAGVSLADFNNDGLVDIYFTANETSDKLYINKGDLTFKDVTKLSEIDNSKGWTTGVTNVDINNDGLMDIYISKVGKHLGIKGHNLLYVNKGIENGIPRFEEESNLYNLDIVSYVTQSAFFDYDLDGDLDVYILNHSVHPNSNYGKGINRTQIDSLSGDLLLENQDGKFVDVSVKAGIFQGKIGYGLGISVSDINSDGYPDLYIGNDFFENDYLYINQQDGTFKEMNSIESSVLGHTTHFSMGNAVADLNNDLLADIVSLDMLPENLVNYKTSGLEYAYPVYENYLRNGYSHQYMQNTLHLNSGNGNFKEIGYLSGIAATEWSWSPLAADFDNDGLKDLYISNGIVGATNDMDFINYISNDKIQKQLGRNLGTAQLKLINELPEKRVSNYMLKNTGDSGFKNVSSSWLENKPSFSNGAAYADLDNDGDLDIVVNNVNEEAFILENTCSNDSKNNFLKLRFEGSTNNVNGIGARAIIYTNGKAQTKENYNTKGFMSSTEPALYFGLGENKVDSMTIIWADKSFQTLTNIVENSTINVSKELASGDFYQHNKANKSDINYTSFEKFKHDERSPIEFIRDPLVPYASTNLGPDVSVSDVNNDGLEDFFISGAKGQASELFFQNTNGTFISVQKETFAPTALNEDIGHAFADLNNDGWQDLVVVSGGNEFKTGKAIQPRLYLNNNGDFSLLDNVFEGVSVNASKVLVEDLDGDGLRDVIITSDNQDLQFGKTPMQYIFKNKGDFSFENITVKIAPEFQHIGNVKDIVLKDIDNDEDLDMIVVGHWMPISIFRNDKGVFKLVKSEGLQKSNGWWNAVAVEDFDKDGDLDIVAGNWGLNSRLTTNEKEPITLYNYDFDDNGKIDPIVTYFHQGTETPFASKEDISKQLPYINKKYLSFAEFARADIEDVFGKDKLQKASKKMIFELASCYFENKGNLGFKKIRLPNMAQVSSVFNITTYDVNNDGFYDIYLTGNNFEISTQLSRLDASQGELLTYSKESGFQIINRHKYNVFGAVRNVSPIKIGQSQFLIVARNNDTPLFLKLDIDENEQ